jgi:DDE superfamily endonuclease
MVSVVREVDINHLRHMADDSGRIRALVMNLLRCLKGTEAAHLVDGLIGQIQFSLDRIKEIASQPLERRRPYRAEYSNPHLVGLLRHSTDMGSKSDHARTDQWNALETTVPSGSDSQTAAEFAQIRALVMNVHSVLRGTEAAHLVTGPLEHIHRSLDRIEQSVERVLGLRRTGMIGHIGSDLPSMQRDRVGVGPQAQNDQSDVHFAMPAASPLSQVELEMTAAVSGSISRDPDAVFVAQMEDVLEVYQRPHDPAYPVVCVDETSKQFLGETRVPIAATPGQSAQLDYEYERKGTANLFMLFAPLEGWRYVKVTDQHGALDYAQVLKDLSDTHFRDAKKIILVQDSLNTHKPASLYEAFPAAEARRLVERFEWHIAPGNGSWLDMAKSELGALSSQCLDRRIPDKQTLVEEVAAWKDRRDKNHAAAGFHFTTAEARVKLKKLYPQGDRAKSLT